MLRQRVVTSLICVPVLLAAVWVGSPWLVIVVALASLLGTFEFYRLSNSAGWNPFSSLGLLFVLLFILNAYFGDERTTMPLISGVVILSLIRLLWCADKGKAFTNWVWSIGGIFYIGWTMSHFVLLRGLEDGRSWILVVFLVTFASDTCAFFIGRALGKRRLAPAISPAKTWEGAFGGVIGAITIMVILHPILGLAEISYAGLIILAVLISVFAQLGDLAGSMLKRAAGVKEAGKLIPGHGGILDRMDSLIFTVVVVYYYVVWVV